MVAAVIGASSESTYVIEKAKELGLTVVALDGNPEAPGLKAADASFVVDIRKPEAVFEVLDKYNISVVLPVPIGRYLTTTGAVNDHYGLCGVSYKAACLCTDKYEFHRVLSIDGLRDAELYLVPAGQEITYTDEINTIYPVVVKPRHGSGSRGVEIFNTPEELEREFIANQPYDEDYCIETCVPGEEYGVDGVFVKGEFKLILLRSKKNTRPPYRQCVGYYSERRCEENALFYDRVTELLSKTGRTLGFENNIIHADIIRAKGDKPFIIETSARPSGHNLHNLFTPMASGVDEVTEFIKLAVPELNMPYSFEAKADKNMLIHYFDFEDVVIKRVPDEEYIRAKYPVKAWKCNITPGMDLGRVTDGASVMGRGYYCLEADSKEELDKYSEEIKAEFEPEEKR